MNPQRRPRSTRSPRSVTRLRSSLSLGRPAQHRRGERGSGTLLTLFMGLVLATAVAMAILWSAISIARHKLATAADLTALSAAQALASGAPDPCTTAHRIATTHHVDLADCQLATDSVSIRVTTQLHLAAIAHPTLSATARAGPT
jgi:secretion/DNA translocation related TadE-like protein